jgi:hypothetical protein
LVTNFYAHDQRFHGELKRRAEAELRAHRSVEQMKQTSGKYSEIELVKSDSAQDEDNRDAGTGVKMNTREWDENVQKLAAMFGDGAKNGSAQPQPARRGVGAPITQIKTGVLSPLQEDEGRYCATAVIKKTKDRLKLATVEWGKEPLEIWRARAENQMPKAMVAATASYTLPTILEGAGGCIDDIWIATASGLSSRSADTAVWTGSEMIVWGGAPILNTVGRYNPSTDAWTATSTTNAPSDRERHTAVWTGTEMIIWGGDDGSSNLNTGGRYNPGTDSWTATGTTNAPMGRFGHTTVWTGTEMIVWGGADIHSFQHFNTGGRYNQRE